jgi:hypothetical protein
MKTYLVHWESAGGAHLWQKAACPAPPTQSDTVLAVFVVPVELTDWPVHELAPIAHTLEKVGRAHA